MTLTLFLMRHDALNKFESNNFIMKIDIFTNKGVITKQKR